MKYINKKLIISGVVLISLFNPFLIPFICMLIYPTPEGVIGGVCTPVIGISYVLSIILVPVGIILIIIGILGKNFFRKKFFQKT